MKKLDFQLKVVLISLISLISLSILLMPLYFINLHHIVSGLLLGIALNSIYFLVDHFISKKDDKLGITFTVISLIIKFLLLGGFMFLFSYLEFSLGLRIANVFSFIGGYFITLIIALIIYLIKRRENVSIK